MEKKKDGWFFNKNIIEEINELPDELFIEEVPEEKENPEETSKLAGLQEALLETKTEKKKLEAQVAELINEKTALKTALEEAKNGSDTGLATLKINYEKLGSDYEEEKKAKEKVLHQLSQYKRLIEESKTVIEEKNELVRKEQIEKKKLAKAVQESNQDRQLYNERMEAADAQIKEWKQRYEEKTRILEETRASILDSSDGTNQLMKAEKEIQELKKRNEELQLEVGHSQQEIGEVLVSAKKQAKRTVEEAEADAKRMMNSAEMALEKISHKVKKISVEVNESRKNVAEIYDDLQFKIEKLVQVGSLDKEEID
ncbi:hypothetical protein BAU15_03490 [Enterococcus sp. JM4C]|uniref:hypothetical protein n=1 Tax=Candidatus Enterococcus huntleyi TaxID=1857217 RepID=UPI00137A65E7|nr:hypothetical protein [Enterococcus sp. JM4C]KAF1295616.1 hypothetical protein BAU15_03490 [Enterococcus sp. JM4C]